MAQARQRRVHVTEYHLAVEGEPGNFLTGDMKIPLAFKTRAQAEKALDKLKTKKKYQVVEARHAELR